MSFFYQSSVDSVCRNVHHTVEESSFWRVDDPELGINDQGQKVIKKGGMWPTHRAFWQDPRRIKALVGGMGSGKTLTLCKRMIALALANAPVPTATVSPTFNMAMKTIIPTMNLLLTNKRSLLGRAFWWRYVGNPIPTYIIRYHGRTATIWILSSDNPLSLRGPNLAAVGVDEPFMQPRVVYNEVIGRVREPTAVKREIVMAGTPESLNNWGYDLCMGELGDADNIAVYQVSTLENKIIPDSYITDMEATYSPRAIKAYRDGKFVDMTENQVYYEFSAEEHGANRPTPDSAELGIGMDFNVNPMAATVFWRAGDYIHYMDEIELPNCGTEGMCIELRKRYPNIKDVYPDATGAARKTSSDGTDHSILKKYGYELHCNKTNPAVRDRENTVNGKFKAANGKITCTVGKKCKLLRKYLALYSHKDRNSAEQKRMSHLIDAFGYPICQIFPIAGYTTREQRYA